ncbi:MAG: S46 family peptidase, partial [Acidobacteria bacterium]|nr:S46 family peptidase [Acidobacteriota bacterium]
MTKRVVLALSLVFGVFLAVGRSEEGMYPVNDLARLNLKAKGLQIETSDIYNPNGTSLIQAVVNIPGCTASFVSNDGLMVTNHHCAFGAVQAASSAEHDYVTDGFLAETRAKELRARNFTARITEEVRDMSAEVLSAVTPDMAPLDRAKALETRIAELTKKGQAERPGKTVAISEMLAGKSYVMFISTTFRDVRLVYVPQRSIGEFGGEDDNWVWPRHTGDFSFLRVYAAPDGSPADYADANVPLHPKRYLKVNPAGANEEDFVFVLGYPGRTFRHQTSFYLDYEEHHRMPFIADANEWLINTMDTLGKGNRAVALKFDARSKTLANTMKNYRGKLAGMSRLKMVDAKRADQVGLQQYIDAVPQRKAAFGTVLADTGKVYAEMSSRAAYELTLDNLTIMSLVMNAGATVAGATEGAARVNAASFANYDDGAERAFLKKALMMAGALPSGQRIAPLDAALKNDYSDAAVAAFVADAFAHTTLTSANGLTAALSKAPENDAVVTLARALAPLQRELRETRARRTAELSKLSALLIDVKQQYQQASFIPDANSTLRFTYGHVRGYSPADA